MQYCSSYLPFHPCYQVIKPGFVQIHVKVFKELEGPLQSTWNVMDRQPHIPAAITGDEITRWQAMRDTLRTVGQSPAFGRHDL